MMWLNRSNTLIGQATAIAFDAKNGEMYVTLNSFHVNKQGNIDGSCLRNITITCLVSVIDTASNTVVKTITVGRGPTLIGFNPKNGDMYVGNERDRTISVIDTASNTVVKNISLAGSPSAIGFNPKSGISSTLVDFPT